MIGTKGLIAHFDSDTAHRNLFKCVLAVGSVIVLIGFGYWKGIDKGWDMAVRDVKYQLFTGAREKQSFFVSLDGERMKLTPRSDGSYVMEVPK